MTTTAVHRTLARECADALQWGEAAKHMRKAITLYPGAPHKAGTLASVDVFRMTKLAEAWEAQALKGDDE